MRNIWGVIGFILILFFSSHAVAQETVHPLDGVHLFQTFLRDAPISAYGYGEGGVSFSNFPGSKEFNVGVQGALSINPQFEIGTRFGFVNYNPEFGNGGSGLSDLTLLGKYNLNPAPVNISVGGYATVPVGSDKAGAGHLNFGGFGALRYPVSKFLAISGVAGLDFREVKRLTVTNYDPGDPSNLQLKEENDYETSLLLGGGFILALNRQLHIVGELNIWSEGHYGLLSGGIDYALSPYARIRGALGLGLSSGAPDIKLMGSYLLSL